MSDVQIQRVAGLIAPEVVAKNWPTDHYDTPAAGFFLAATLGMTEALLPIVQGWKPEAFAGSGWDHTHYLKPQLIVFGLGSPQLVEAEMRRLKLPLNLPRYVRGWLATTEYAALGGILRALRCRNDAAVARRGDGRGGQGEQTPGVAAGARAAGPRGRRPPAERRAGAGRVGGTAEGRPRCSGAAADCDPRKRLAGVARRLRVAAVRGVAGRRRAWTWCRTGRPTAAAGTPARLTTFLAP
jgi:hypothetical protein